MDELGGFESFAPSEGGSGASEQASEAAKQRFAGTGAALRALQKEEKKAKKRDDGVAQAIMQFLTDAQRAHLATLISRLVALNCPSHFIIAVLSLISPDCHRIVIEYLKENAREREEALERGEAAVALAGELSAEANRLLVEWVARMDAVLENDRQSILQALLVSEKNLDGTILQLTTFVLQEFLHTQHKAAAFEKLQPLAISILHSLFEPHLREYEKLEDVSEEEDDEKEQE